jgi:RNA 2',3'-cyclic 3'-phosphodiesterase
VARGQSQRFFLGVPLAGEAREALRAHLDQRLSEGGAPGRTVPDGNWHLTLRFLGQVAPWLRAKLVAELEAADLGPSFDLRLERGGAFPGLGRARVLWLGAGAGAAAFTAMAQAVERASRRAGFNAERRPVVPHLTLSRLKRPSDVGEVVERLGSADIPLRVDRVVLFCSHLGGGPARYEEQKSFPLRG